MNFRDKVALVVDNGLFVHIAVKLAEEFGEVCYWTPSVNAFPKSNLILPGDGIDEIKRVTDFWPAARDADLIVFADVMFADMQEECVRQGKRVFGSRWGENLELKRWQTKQFLKSINMPVAETHLIVGIEKLRRFIQDKPDFWVKTSRFRGDFETFHAKTYDRVKPRLDELEYSLGMKGEIYQFVCERAIPAIVEVGYDGFTVDGKFPETAWFGVEVKDTGYIGTCKPYAEIPEQVKWVNEMISDRLKRDQYRGFFSTEIRCMDKDEEVPEPTQWEDSPMLYNRGEVVPETDTYAFLTDPCCRCASPPSEAYIEWAHNWPEIMWYGAEGKVVDIDPVAKYAVEIMLHSSWADKSWQPVMFPKEIRQWVKLRNLCCINGVYSAVPQAVGLPEIGAVVGLADTLPDAIKLAVERANEVDGYYVEAKSEAIPKAIGEIESAQDAGVKFTDDPIPTAEELEDLQPAE